MSKAIRYVAFAVAVAVAAGLATDTAVASDPRTNAAEFLPGLVDSSEIDAAPVIEGRIVDVHGQPAEGAQVQLLAWPPQEVMSTTQVGESVRVDPVAKAVSDSRGRFSMRIAGSVDLSRYLGKSTQMVDFEVRSVDQVTGAWTSYSFSAVPSSAANGTRTWSNPDLMSDSGSSTPYVDLSLASGVGTQAGVTEAVAESNAQVVPGDKALCATVLQSTYSPSWDLIGQAYLDTSGVSALFTYSTGASSTLGVGTSSSGSYGSFSASGTSSKSSTATQTYASISGSGVRRYFDTQFRYGKYQTSISTPCGLPGFYVYYARVYSFVGGTRTRTPSSSPSATLCAAFQAGSSFTKSTSSAITWSNGMDMNAAIGLNLSTRTGYTATAKLKFTFTAARRLCGTNGYPGETPSQLVAKT